jgi:hypothetical protein
VSDGLGFGLVTFGGLIPPPVSDGLGFFKAAMPPAKPFLPNAAAAFADGRVGLRFGLVIPGLIAFFMGRSVGRIAIFRLIDFLPISFRKILLPLSFQSLQQQ